MKREEPAGQALSALPIPLMRWFAENARDLPWRREPTPYHVWISEIMLQQTRVQTVLDYYDRFLRLCPDIPDLAALEEERLMKVWQGLGYYSRARNMQLAARQIMKEYEGELPADYEKLKALPGIGPYTAGAVASIAYGLPCPAVDGNALRVVARLTGDRTDISTPAMKKKVTDALQAVMPVKAPGQFNQALMELGAVVCLPGTPRCQMCPASHLCLALRRGETEKIPVKAPRKPRKIEKLDVFLIFRLGRVALRRRPGKGLLAGLWEFPNAMSPAVCPVAGRPGARMSGKHIFTHVEWDMTGRVFYAEKDELPADWIWADQEELEQKYALPSAFDCFRPLVEDGIRETAP